jgi:4-hydroxybenzoate polyprenyltransferase
MGGGVRAGGFPRPGWGRQAVALGRDIKLSHSVFALPFAVLGMMLAAGWAGRLPRVIELLLIVFCMVTARTYAMAVNRWADATIDAANPRTAKRALPSGRVGRGFMVMTIGLSASGLVGGAAGFWIVSNNAWPVLLSPLVLAVLSVYSFAKRFTWACHLLLGFALAISPVAAAVAIEPGYLGQPTAWLLAGMVLCWVAGFDVIYALQDVGFDRQAGLFSMPATLGEDRAIWISRFLHVGAWGLLVAAWWVSPQLQVMFAAAVIAVGVLLVLEHFLIWRSPTRHLNMAFFTVNGVVSVLLGLAGCVDVWLRI